MGGSSLGGGHRDALGNPTEAEPRPKTIAELDREECDAAVKSEESREITCMDIYSPPGTRVRFAHPTNGWPIDQETAAKHLVVGEVYTVDGADVHSSSTTVYLVGYPDVGFNSVMFEEVPDAEPRPIANSSVPLTGGGDLYTALVAKKEGPLAGGPAGVVIAESKVTQGGLIENPDGAWVYDHPEDESKAGKVTQGELVQNPDGSLGAKINLKESARENLAIENRLWETRKEQGDRIKQLECELEAAKDATVSTVELLQAEKERWAQERYALQRFAQQGVSSRKEVERVEKERDHWKVQAEKLQANCANLRECWEKASAQNETLIHGIIRLMELLRKLEDK